MYQYRFSFVKNYFGQAVEVNREMFRKILQRKDVKRICKKIAKCTNQEEIGKEKRKLPAFCWHGWFVGGKRKNYLANPSGLVMIDLDHLEKPEEFFKEIKEKAVKMGLLVAHITPSTKGLRLVFPVPQGMDIVEAQAYYVKALKLTNVDACTKDLARLSFCVPEGYFLYIDEDELFKEASPTPIAPNPDPSPARGKGVDSINPEKEAQTELQSERIVQESKKFEENYKGIPYKVIVSTLEMLLGGQPAHGSRNNFIFSMSCYLRYICDDNPDWIASILPDYGEERNKWRRTIESACQRAQNKTMPQIMKRAINLAMNKTKAVSEDLPPEMPKNIPRLIEHLIKNVPLVCRPAVAVGVFPALASHLKGVKFWLLDGTEKEATFMVVCMAKQSSGKSAINKPIEYIMADIEQNDEWNRQREQEWKDATTTKGANKEKPKRPDDICVQILSSDMTNACFVQRLLDAERAGGKYLYTNIEELELLNQLQTNGTQNVGKIICLAFDNGKYGQERIGTQSVTARVKIRWNWNASSTIQKGMAFFKGRMVDGTLTRINFSTIIPDKSKPFIYGRYDEKFAEDLKPYITNLNLASGEIECQEALDMARKLSEECADRSALWDDEVYEDLSYRAITSAYLKAMVLYIAHDMTWTKEIEDFCVWAFNYDMWCKCHFFGAELSDEKAAEKKIKKRRGRQNMLNLLPECFSLEDAALVREQCGLDAGNTKGMLALWTHRGYIEQDSTGRYTKTELYLSRVA